VYFNAEAEKKKTKNTYSEISFNDTLILDANNPDIASDTIKSFLYRKYAPWYENQSEMIDDYSIDVMKYDLMSHKFDTLYVNNQAQYYKPIEELFYNINNEVVSEESIDDEVVSIEEDKEDIPVDKINDNNNEVKTIVVYFQDKDKICLEEGEKAIKEGTYSTEKIKNKKDKENKYIGFAVLLSLLSFVQAIMLWFAFLNRKKDNNQALIDDLNQSKQKSTHHTSSDNFDIPKNVAVPSTSDMPKPTTTITSKEPKPTTIPTGKIAINSVDVYNLMTIPVLNYSQALLIITERNNNGRYISIEDIKLRNTLTEELATAIASHVYVD
jgi:DNA uptake protein ComE-like DNA-binding protein